MTEEDWRELSALPRKWHCYAEDPYFRESWHDCQARFQTHVFEILQRVALVMFKPEAQFGDRFARTMRFLLGHGFQPVVGGSLLMNYWSCRELWRFQWQEIALPRIRACAFLTSLDESFLVLLLGSRPTDMPASTRLASLKGITSDDQNSLRALLGARGPILSFVHISDEPADVIRELGILVDSAKRGDWLEAIGRAAVGSDRQEVDPRLVSWTKGRQGSQNSALVARDVFLSDLCAKVQGEPVACDLLDRLSAGRPVEPEAVFQALESIGIRTSGWEAVAITSACYDVPSYRENTPPLSTAN